MVSDKHGLSTLLDTTDIFLSLGSFSLSTVYLEMISPEIILLRPPEKLILEIKVTGRYADILWEKDGEPLSNSWATFSNYEEILVIGETTTNDFGYYQVLVHSPPSTAQLLVPSTLSIIVTSSGECIH